MNARAFFLLGLSLGLLAAARPTFCQAAPDDAPQVTPDEIADQTGESLPGEGRHWQHTVKKALAEEQFAQLDEIASQLRTARLRQPGGRWKLQDFYSIIDSIGASDAEAEARIARLERWIAARPESITPRVGEAGALSRWAWRARGGGTADTVTDEGWKLFFARLSRADKVLTEAQKLGETCPQMYFEWLKIGMGLEWEHEKMQALFDRAVKSEPDYVLNYHIYMNYLQPKWGGDTGEATGFAKTIADRRGGADGDALYYQMALNLIHRGNPGISSKEMDWARIQRGYATTKERFGVTALQEEQMAYMAWRFRDAAFAEKQFEMLGAKWSKSIWHDEEKYNKARAWAKNHS